MRKEVTQMTKEVEQNPKEAIASKLLQIGMEIELVADSTGLTRAEVMDIQRDVQ
ncbi:hypothetical protein [Lentibacillus jeotgali]|uniref:hypothetical protein n=1 Tax=Lentibacillus jeotgali TaxID=558169 RepID=UPI0002EFFE49|nr:hypothetical protein [Lentibacillus jeotgali]